MPELKFDIDNKFEQTLAELVTENDKAGNKADVVQRAIATYKYFRSLPAGAKIQVVGNDGRVIVPDVAVP